MAPSSYWSARLTTLSSSPSATASPERQKEMYPSTCACKGIRSCDLCNDTNEELSFETSSNVIFIYCDACRQAIRMDIYESRSQCPHHDEIGNDQIAFPLDGIYLVADFLSETEEDKLLTAIDNDIWIPSQSGRLKQDFGIKINFKKQTIKTKYFTGMPMYSQEVIQRLQTHRLLTDFQSVELCNLDYRSERGSHIDPHIDDTWIWGERLITINLLSNTILCLIPKEEHSNKIIYIPLPRRWMIVLYGDARYEYKHAIQRRHIHGRRLAVTFREFTSKNEKFYEENKDLYEKILRISQRFTGISVGRFEHIVTRVTSTIPEKIESNIDDELNAVFQSLEPSSIKFINSSTYELFTSTKSLVKLIPHSFISLEQIQSIVHGEVLRENFHQSFLLRFSDFSNEQLGQILAHWRSNMRCSTWTNPFDHSWFDERYARLIQKKKNSYPFLLSNLYTCEDKLASINNDNPFDYGPLWNNPSEHSFYLFDLATSCLERIEQVKEIIDAYQTIVRLTDDDWEYLDTFIRLRLICNFIESTDDDDDEKQLDLLEQFSSQTFFVRNLCR